MLSTLVNAREEQTGICKHEGNLSALGKLGGLVRRGNFSKNLSNIVNDLVKSLRREEEIIECEKFGAATRKNILLERNRENR